MWPLWTSRSWLHRNDLGLLKMPFLRSQLGLSKAESLRTRVRKLAFLMSFPDHFHAWPNLNIIGPQSGSVLSKSYFAHLFLL